MIRNVGYRDVVEQYCESILDGSIAACEMVKAAVRRFQSDLERQRTVEFPYYFDTNAAECGCEFYPQLLRHTIGPAAGQPFQLAPWQCFVEWNIDGWKRVADDKRRFRKAFILVARKNGKSTWMAGRTIKQADFDGEAGAQVFIGATKIDQAKIIFDQAEQMVQNSPFIKRNAKLLKHNISFPKSGSYIRPLGSDRPFDGLNPSSFMCDELHAWQEFHRKFYDTMTTGSGARAQPLLFFVTTAADESGLIYHEEINYCRGILNKTIESETVFCVLYELDPKDDPQDESTWVKANPNLGVSVSLEYLREQAAEARAKPQALNRFLRYHCNRNVSSIEGGFTVDLWDTAAGELSDWKEADAVAAGLDLGGRDDLASFALVARFETGQQKDDRPIYRYEAKSWSFISEATKRDLTQQPFAQWVTEGRIEKSKHVVSTLLERLFAQCAIHGVSFVAFDPYNALGPSEQLELEGLTAIKMPQNHGHFNEPIGELLDAMQTGRFTPDVNDVVLKWAALNSAFNRNPRGDVMYDKANAKDKIDAIVAATMALRAVRAAPQRIQGSLYIT